MGSTTVDGFPYPVGTDRVMDGDNAIQALAEALTGRTARTAAGIASLTGAANTTRSQVLTMPAGLFTVPPVCLISSRTANGTPGTGLWALWTGGSPTTTAITIAGAQANTNPISISWLAIQAAHMPAPTMAAMAAASGPTVATTCPTPGCHNATDPDGHPRTIDVSPVWTDDDGDHVADAITCGACGALLWANPDAAG